MSDARPSSVRLERTKAWLLPAVLGAVVSAGGAVATVYAFAGKFFVTTEVRAADAEKLKDTADKHEEKGHPVLQERVRVLRKDVREIKGLVQGIAAKLGAKPKPAQDDEEEDER